MELHDSQQARYKASAAEGALLILVERLAMRGAISVDEGIDILQLLSLGSSVSSERISQATSMMSRLRRLRGGDASIAPGAPAAGPQV